MNTSETVPTVVSLLAYLISINFALTFLVVIIIPIKNPNDIRVLFNVSRFSYV